MEQGAEMTLTAEARPDADYLSDDDRPNWPEIRFTARLGQLAAMTFEPEEGAPKEAWEALAAACEREGAARQDWAPSNGEMSIQVAGGEVVFVTARRGDGRGGAQEGRWPAAVCGPAFRQAAALTEQWKIG